MNDDKLSALKQVNLLIVQLHDALNDPELTLPERKLIEEAINDQSDVRDTLIENTLQAMVEKINSANPAMVDLTNRMEKTSEKLAKLAASIKKVADVLGMLAAATTKVLSSGALGGA